MGNIKVKLSWETKYKVYRYRLTFSLGNNCINYNDCIPWIDIKSGEINSSIYRHNIANNY